MALDVSAKNLLLHEIPAAERLRNLHIECADTLVRNYVGYSYRKDWNKGDPAPANHAYEFIQLMLGRLVFDNPAVNIGSRNSKFAIIAAALEDATNQWIAGDSLSLLDVWEAIVLESMFCYGVGKVRFDEYGPQTQLGTRNMKPCLEQVNYWRYFRDPLSCRGLKCRYEGEVCYADQNDLLTNPEFDTDMVKQLVADADMEKVGKMYKQADAPDRNQIPYYELWVPGDEDDDEQYHGTIYTLATMPSKTGDKPVTQYIRKPKPFFGPKTGPYVVFGGFPVPGSPYALAPLMATKEQADELNLHETAISESALQMKDVYMVDAAQNALAETIKDARHGTVHKIKGFNPALMQKVEIGGPSDSHIGYAEYVRARLDRVSGINDAMRGELDPNVTATANNVAASAASVRVDTQIRFTRRSVARVMTNVAWYEFHSEMFTQALSQEFTEELAQQVEGQNPQLAQQIRGAEIHFAGGPHAMSNGLKFEDLSLDIEPYSMERVDPAMMQVRAQQFVTQAIQLAQAQATMPYVNFDPIWELYARAYNFNWTKKLVNKQMLMQFLQAQQAGAQSQQQKPLVPYRDAPGDIKAQMEAKDGYQPSQLWPQVGLFDPNQPKQSGLGMNVGAAA